MKDFNTHPKATGLRFAQAAPCSARHTPPRIQKVKTTQRQLVELHEHYSLLGFLGMPLSFQAKRLQGNWSCNQLILSQSIRALPWFTQQHLRNLPCGFFQQQPVNTDQNPGLTHGA